MGKTIQQISNFPYSSGATAGAGTPLGNSAFKLKTENPAEYLRQLLEFSRDIIFHQKPEPGLLRWSDLLEKDSVFALIAPLQIPVNELNTYFNQLPLINGFSDNNIITEEEYLQLAYQRFQLVHRLLEEMKNTWQLFSGQDYLLIRAGAISPEKIHPVFLRYASVYAAAFEPLFSAVDLKALENYKHIAFEKIDKNSNTRFTGLYNAGNAPLPDLLGIYATQEEKAKALNEILRQVFGALSQRFLQFQQQVGQALQKAFTEDNSHQPHNGLLIAFSRLMAIFDARYNRLAAEQTEFIYKEVLQLERQKPLPDKAFLHLELAKNIHSQFLPAQTHFKGGKNTAGKAVYYQSAEDIVLNAATISSVKSFTRLRNSSGIYSLSGAADADAEAWKVNGAWIPFNNVEQVYSGLQFHSKVLEYAAKKDLGFRLEISFASAISNPGNILPYLQLTLVLQDNTEITPEVFKAALAGNTLSISAKLNEEIKLKTAAGANLRLGLLSPTAGGTPKDPAYAAFYQAAFQTKLSSLHLHVDSDLLLPHHVETAYGEFPAGTAFLAFGATSRKGASFKVHHPLLPFTNKAVLNIEWAEPLAQAVTVNVNDEEIGFSSGDAKSNETLTQHINEPVMELVLSEDVANEMSYAVGESTATLDVPVPVMIKLLQINAGYAETIYEEATTEAYFVEDRSWKEDKRQYRKAKSSTNSKSKQKEYLKNERRKAVQASPKIFANALSYTYPLGAIKIYSGDEVYLLPDLTKENFNEYGGELCIGIKNILPGQSLSLLFSLAEETAGQTKESPHIEWFYVSGEHLKKFDAHKITDTTLHFTQSGLVKLMLPEDADASSQLIEGEGLYWIVARCDFHYEAAANFHGIYANGLGVERVLDAANDETKVSVAVDTIQQLYPKLTQVKKVNQPLPSSGGRLPETESHYFDRSSERLRHKSRAVQQWDVEHLVVEQFPYVYRAVSYNHTEFNEVDHTLNAVPGKTLLVLVPFFNHTGIENARPALSLSKLEKIEQWLKARCSPFLQVKAVNAPWDEISIDLEVMVNEDVLDLPFYKEKLREEIYRFLMPWAFEASAPPAFGRLLYFATLVDHIDELHFVHHILSMKIYRNGLEVSDVLRPSTPVHLLASSLDHNIILKPYGING